MKRCVLRCRWYWAFIALFVIVAGERPLANDHVRGVVHIPNGGWLLVLLAGALYLGTWRFFGSFAIAAAYAGAALAVVLRRWNSQHPASVLEPASVAPSVPVQINLSSIRVPGDGPGLTFAIGTVVTVVLALPGLWWYFVGIAVGSAVVSIGLVTMRSMQHPDFIQNHISLGYR